MYLKLNDLSLYNKPVIYGYEYAEKYKVLLSTKRISFDFYIYWYINFIILEGSWQTELPNTYLSHSA
jgi:hypothetical protein